MVRVNQVGYAPGAPKVAYAMLAHPVRGALLFVIEGRHGVVYRGQSGTDLGPWNAGFGAVYRLGFSAFRMNGEYRIRLTGFYRAVSPPFRIASPGALYPRLVRNGVRYFTSERDGADVIRSVLDRRPANLTDRHAYVYADPRYNGNDTLIGGFRRIGGPVNVAGGWFDAGGGYEKFAYTASYADGLLLLAARDYPGRYRTLRREAEFGLSWLRRLWNPRRKVMYIQVGIGNGNNCIHGDYDFWFLPQAEDRLHAPSPTCSSQHMTAYYVKYRPVFEAAPPGERISPDFAGRFAADFALGAQLAVQSGRRPSALRLLRLARGVYAMARTRNVGQIVTTFPHDYYPGSEWKSDMLWGAAEIALADEALHAPRPAVRHDLRIAARWARAYIAQGHPADGDTLNLYDNGALGEAELLQAMRSAGQRVIAPARLLADMAAQLRLGERYARAEPFGLGTTLGPSDATPHAFGLFITDALYQRYGGAASYQGFAQQQLNFALGANAWGTSFVVGAGSTFPHCMQSEIANLAGSLTGRGNIQLGATTDGPSSASNFVGLGTVPGMRACSAGHYERFNTTTVGYEDNVVSWPSVEPADDYTANSTLAFALAAGGLG